MIDINHSPRREPQLRIRVRIARESTPHAVAVVLVYDVLHRSIRAASQNSDADDEDARIHDGQRDVPPPLVPFAFLDQLEPEERRKVEREPGDE